MMTRQYEVTVRSAKKNFEDNPIESEFNDLFSNALNRLNLSFVPKNVKKKDALLGSSKSIKMTTDVVPLCKSKTDDETSSQVSAKSNTRVDRNTGLWMDEEHKLFLHAREDHGNFWVKIASIIKTRDD